MSRNFAFHPCPARNHKLPILLLLALACAGPSTPAHSQAAASEKPAPAPASFSGCVQRAPNSNTDLVISTPTACAKLSGKLATDQLAGHHVDLKGVLTPRTASASASIQVDSVIKVGEACSDVCSLQPPHSRGLHRPESAVPGSEGGTPGETAPSPSPATPPPSK
jgi:hypothetical protein